MKNYICVSNDELKGNVRELSYCPNCGELHKTTYGKVKEGDEWIDSKMLAFVECDKNNETYLVGINQKQLTKR